MKFDHLLRWAEAHGLDYVVTGQYARVEQDEATGRWLLKQGLAENNDQSYGLYNLTQEQLAHVRLPLGSLHKSEVRAIAEQQHFVNARKHDSQDICFVPDGDYAKVIESRTGKTPEPGPFLDLNGNVVGTHRGIIHYTVGQRRGLRMPSDGKIYVVKILPERNAVECDDTVAQGQMISDGDLLDFELFVLRIVDGALAGVQPDQIAAVGALQ